MVTTVEKIIRTPDDLRVILDGGRKQRPLINRCHIESGRTKLYREVAHERTGSAGDTGAAV